MRPQKPRPFGGIHATIANGFSAVGVSEGQPAHGVRLVADFEGKAEGTVYRWTDADARDANGREIAMSATAMHRVAERWPAFAAGLADHFAQLAGGNFVPREKREAPRRWLELSTETAEEMSRFVVLVVRATSPDSPGGQEIVQREAQSFVGPLIEIRDHVDDLITNTRQLAEGKQ